jgi:mannose-6-phosphate isomerase-like protein (cupin superfamily)
MTETPPVQTHTDLKLAQVRGTLVPMSCQDLEPTLSFLTERMGFRLDSIFPADDPHTAILSGHGLGIRLERGAQGGVGVIDLLCAEPPAPGERSVTAPNGVLFRLVAAEPPLRLPPVQQALVLTRAPSATDTNGWGLGRAGLRYRDLLPQRHGGAFIVSHIRVLDGGPVPDYVHFHKVRFQIIFVRRGWVRVVYEDQGPPFVMQAGDCVLQPPEIRHRVLESSQGAEVVEICAPAEHITMADHRLELPTVQTRSDRLYGGQHFVWHRAAQAAWTPWRMAGFEVRDTGVGAATSGLGGVRVLRRAAGAALDKRAQRHDTEFCHYFVLSGQARLRADRQVLALAQDDSVTIPGGMAYSFEDTSPDLELLETTLPAKFSFELT